MNKLYTHELTIAELAALPDDAIDTSDIPPLDETFWRHATLREPGAEHNAAPESAEPRNTPPAP